MAGLTWPPPPPAACCWMSSLKSRSSFAIESSPPRRLSQRCQLFESWASVLMSQTRSVVDLASLPSSHWCWGSPDLQTQPLLFTSPTLLRGSTRWTRRLSRGQDPVLLFDLGLWHHQGFPGCCSVVLARPAVPWVPAPFILTRSFKPSQDLIPINYLQAIASDFSGGPPLPRSVPWAKRGGWPPRRPSPPVLCALCVSIALKAEEVGTWGLMTQQSRERGEISPLWISCR